MWRINDISIDCRENQLSRVRCAGCDDCVCIEKAAQYVCALPKKSKRRRATRSKKYDRFLGEWQIAEMIYEHFRATGAYEAVQGLSGLFNIRLLIDDFQDFDVRWNRALLSASEADTEEVLEGLYKKDHSEA